ncbi:hypothetical protein BROUX41_005617 [Berkeleyomyces rouxiae]|uniref:uncharacterized protein n=1 Tax=Berkeleyomyces rouxiae TaxID=2035830 RepID=UPI003B77FC41
MPSLGLFYHILRRRDDDDDDDDFDDNDSDFGDDFDDFPWDNAHDSDSGISPAAVAGIVIVVLVLALFAIGLCLFIRRRKRRANSSHAAKDIGQSKEPTASSSSSAGPLPIAVRQFCHRIGTLITGAAASLGLGNTCSRKDSQADTNSPPPEYSEHDPSTVASSHAGEVELGPRSVVSASDASPPPVPAKIA